MRVQHHHRRYDQKFVADALALVQRSDRSLHSIARDLGIPQSTLDGWYRSDMARKKKREEAAAAAGAPSSETSAEKIARLEREVAQLRKENENLKEDRAILKKAAAFFAKESE
jgi:transposase